MREMLFMQSIGFGRWLKRAGVSPMLLMHSMLTVKRQAKLNVFLSSRDVLTSSV